MEELKLQKEAMALKTKKFVKFLSSGKDDDADQGDADEKEVDHVDDVPEQDDGGTEEKKDKWIFVLLLIFSRLFV